MKLLLFLVAIYGMILRASFKAQSADASIKSSQVAHKSNKQIRKQYVQAEDTVVAPYHPDDRLIRAGFLYGSWTVQHR